MERIGPKTSWVTKLAQGERDDAGFFDSSVFEAAQRESDEVLKRFLRDGLKNTTVTCVLVGSETALRRWIRYEIFQSFMRGNGLEEVDLACNSIRTVSVDILMMMAPNDAELLEQYIRDDSEEAFAALVQVVPSRGRLAISYLTLYGAYASTVFWVIGHYLNEAHGWRGTLIIFAAINLAVCLPLNWLGLSRREPATEPRETATTKPGETSRDGPLLEGRLRIVGIALFALIMSLNGFVFGVVSLQLVPLLEAAGLAGATAVWVASLKGHGQFAGRLVEIFFGRNLRAMTVARIAIGVLPPALLLLMVARGELWLLVAFTVLLGASQGVITIVRGAVPLALFGTEGYGAVLGLIATPILLVNAFSPTLFALIVDQVGWQNSLYALLACSILTWLAIELMSRWYESARAGNQALPDRERPARS